MSNIFLYNPNTLLLNYNYSNFSSRPTIYFNEEIKTLRFNLIDTLDNIKINETTGILIFQNNIDINIYNINIECTINDIKLYTTFKLIVKPTIVYKCYSFDYGSIYDNILPTINPNNINILFSSNNLPDNIILNNNGLITINNNINIGLYNFMINCTYNNINIDTFVNIKITPIIYYEINNIELNYNEINQSCIPYCYPENDNGHFYISKVLPNNIGLNNNIGLINNNTGIITFKNIDVGKYDLIVNYELNNIIVSTNYTILIKSIFYYNDNPIIDYGIDYISDIPIISQLGGIFYLENINEKITINNNGQIIFTNMDVGNYSLTVYYNKNNSIVSTVYNIIITPNVYYEISELEILYSTSHTSTPPIIKSNLQGEFSILNSINNVAIDPFTGIIHFGFIIDIGNYNLLIQYTINEYCYKIIKYNLTIKPIFTIYNSIQNIIYGNSLDNLHYFSLPSNGLLVFKLTKNNLIIDNDFFINDTTINLTNTDIGNYSIEFIYSISHISTIYTYYYNILPYFNYKNNFLSIDYNKSLLSELPIINPQINGTFYCNNLPENCFINELGIINFTDKMKIQNSLLKIIFKYDDNEISTNFLIHINPVIIYPNNNSIEFIYNPDNIIITSPKPKIIYNNNFNLDITYRLNLPDIINTESNNVESNNNCNILINSEGILQIPSNLNVNTYDIEIICNFNNNLQNSIIYKINVKPKELLVDFIINDKYYDGLNICNISSDLSFDAYYDDSNVGYNKKIFINNIKSTNLNYYINNKICYGNILPKLLDISFNGINKVYDRTNNANVTYNNSLINLTYNAKFENYTSGLQKIIINKINTNNNNYIVNKEYITYAEITKIPIIATIEAFDKYYDGTINANTKIIKINYLLNETNLLNEINLSYDSYYLDSNVKNNKEIIIDNIKINENYSVIFNTVKSSILPKIIIPEINDIDKIYDGTNTTNIKLIINDNLIINDPIVKSFDSYYVNVNVGKQEIIINNIILDGLYKENFIINDIKINANIYPKNIVLEINGKDKYYDNTNIIEGNITIIDKVIDDDINIINYNIIVNNNNVGDNKDIILTDYELIGNTKNNYIINKIIKNTVSILPIEILVKFESLDKMYDNDLKAVIKLKEIIKIIPNNKNIIITSYNANYDSIYVGTNKKIYITNIKFKIINDDNDNNNYYILDTTIYGNILPKPININITGIDKIYNGNNNADIIINNITGLYHEDNIFIQNYKAEFNNHKAENNKIIQVSNIILGGISQNNYYISDIKCKGNIFKKELIVNFTSNDKIYDGLLNTTINYEFINLLSVDQVYIISYNASYLDPNVGENKIIEIRNIILSGNDSENYYISDMCCLGNIIPQEIDINFITNNKEYDGTTHININYDKLPFNITFNSNFEDANCANNKKIIISDIVLDTQNYKLLNNIYIIYGNIYKKKYIPLLRALDKIYDESTNVIIENIDNTELKYNASFISSDVNNNIKVIVNDIYYNNNYYCDDLILYANIYPKLITIPFNFNSKEYDNTLNVYINNTIQYNFEQYNIKQYNAIYTNKNCGISTILVTNIILSSKNYYCIDLSCNAIVTPKLLDIVFSTDIKYYDGTTNIDVKEISNNKYISDDVYVKYATANFINEYIGINKKIIISNVILEGYDKNNYIVNDNYITYNTIEPKELYIIVDILDKEYDGTTNVNINSIKLDGIIKNEDVYIKSYEAFYNDNTVENNKIININNIILQGIKKNNYYINNFITYGNIITKNINAKFIAYDKKYDNTKLAIVHGSLYNIINNDQVYINNYNALYEDENIGNNKTIFITNIQLGGIDSYKYSINDIIITGNIL